MRGRDDGRRIMHAAIRIGGSFVFLVDDFGHNWSFATHLKDLTPAELQAAMNEAFAQRA